MGVSAAEVVTPLEAIWRTTRIHWLSRRSSSILEQLSPTMSQKRSLLLHQRLQLHWSTSRNDCECVANQGGEGEDEKEEEMEMIDQEELDFLEGAAQLGSLRTGMP